MKDKTYRITIITNTSIIIYDCVTLTVTSTVHTLLVNTIHEDTILFIVTSQSGAKEEIANISPRFRLPFLLFLVIALTNDGYILLICGTCAVFR